MTLPSRYIIRPITGILYLGTAIVASYHLNVWLTKDYTTFRDKSALYGRELKEEEEPSW